MGKKAVGPIDVGVEGHPAPSGRSFDIALASLLLVVTSPLLLFTMALVLIVDGRPIFYRGRRMGLGGRGFTILKLRSLHPDAETSVKGDTLRNRHHLKTRTGNFLRETRIDELPQLINVLRGDMALIGPRPEREEVYGAKCADLHGYDMRFRVRPGIFGYSQVFTPHSTPKRVRTWIDNSFVQRGNAVHRAVTLLALTAFALTSEIGRRVWRFLTETVVRQRLLGRYREQRKTLRVQSTSASAHLERRRSVRPDRRAEASGDPSASADRRESGRGDRRTRSDPGFVILDANEAAMRVSGPGAAQVDVGSELTLRIATGEDRRTRRARVVVKSCATRDGESGAERIVHYTPRSENSSYVIEQYLLKRSIAQLRRHKPKLIARSRP